MTNRGLEPREDALKPRKPNAERRQLQRFFQAFLKPSSRRLRETAQIKRPGRKQTAVASDALGNVQEHD